MHTMIPSWLPVLLGMLLLSLGGISTDARAQDQQAEDDEPSEQPALPTIAPREIEIRGELEISLPSIERQPLTGFNPPPRIPPATMAHKPYVGDYGQTNVALGPDVPESPGPQAALQQPAPPLNGELAAGGGRYFSRHATATVTAPLSRYEAVSFDGKYRGSNGHDPYENGPSSVETAFDTFEGKVYLQSRRDRFGLDVGVGGFYDTYNVYAGVPAFDTSGPTIVRPDREGQNVNVTAGLETYGRVATELDLGYHNTQYTTEASLDNSNEDFVPFGGTTNEQRATASGALHLPLQWPATVSAAFEHATVDQPTNVDDATITGVDAGASVELFNTPTLTVEGGAKLLTFSAQYPTTSDPQIESGVLGIVAEDTSPTYVTPTATLNWYPQDGLSAYVKNTPHLSGNSLADLFQENPYLVNYPLVEPTVVTTDLEGGLNLYRGDVRIAGRAGYRHAPNYPIFVPSGSDIFESGFFRVGYTSARIIHGGVDVSYRHASGFEATVGATVRNGQFTATDTALPYFAPFTANGMVSYAFPEQQGFIQLTTNFQSARYLDANEQEKIDPYWDLDLEVAYDITPLLGLTFSVENISTGTLERWNRYPQPPLTLGTGLRVRW